MWMLRVIFRVNVETEAQQHESSRTNGGALIRTINIRVENPNLHDLAIKDVPILNGDKRSARVVLRNPKSTFARYHYPTGRFAASGGAASGFT